MWAPAQRSAIVLIALVGSSVLLRGPLATQLIARADAALAAGMTATARRLYARADELQPNAVGASRFIALSLISPDRVNIHRALDAIISDPRTASSGSLEFDRSLLEWRIGEPRRAEAHARLAAKMNGGVRPWLFAGILAHRRGDLEQAKRDFEHASGIAPHDRRPRFELTRLEGVKR